MKIRFFLVGIATILVLIAGIYFLRPHTFHGTVIQSPDPSFDLTLKSADGDVSIRDFRGKLVLL